MAEVGGINSLGVEESVFIKKPNGEPGTFEDIKMQDIIRIDHRGISGNAKYLTPGKCYCHVTEARVDMVKAKFVLRGDIVSPCELGLFADQIIPIDTIIKIQVLLQDEESVEKIFNNLRNFVVVFKDFLTSYRNFKDVLGKINSNPLKTGKIFKGDWF